MLVLGRMSASDHVGTAAFGGRQVAQTRYDDGKFVRRTNTHYTKDLVQ